MGRHWWELDFPTETEPDERVKLLRRVRERVTERRKREAALDAWEALECETRRESS